MPTLRAEFAAQLILCLNVIHQPFWGLRAVIFCSISSHICVARACKMVHARAESAGGIQYRSWASNAAEMLTS